MQSKLRKSFEQMRSMRFETSHHDGDVYCGVVVHIGKDFFVVHEQRDFVFDGFILFRKRWIKSIRDGKYEACANKILKFTDEIKRLKRPTWAINCVDIQDAVHKLRRLKIWPIIETVSSSAASFYIGDIAKFDDSDIQFHCYDATGKWKEIRRIPLSDIMRVEVQSKYCNQFNRYMKSVRKGKSKRAR